MAQLFQQLESQQLANYILKNKIESLKASLNTANQKTDDNFFKVGCSSYISRSMPTTPTSLSNETVFQSLLCDKNKDRNIKNNLYNKDFSKISFLTKDDLELNKIHVSKINKFTPKYNQSKIYNKSVDVKDENIKMEIITKNEYIHKKIQNINDKKNFKPADIQNANEINSKKQSREKNVQAQKGEIAKHSKVLASTAKTPKSALLDKRRKAVFELLTHEIYPSGEFFKFT